MSGHNELVTVELTREEAGWVRDNVEVTVFVGLGEFDVAMTQEGRDKIRAALDRGEQRLAQLAATEEPIVYRAPAEELREAADDLMQTGASKLNDPELWNDGKPEEETRRDGLVLVELASKLYRAVGVTAPPVGERC